MPISQHSQTRIATILLDGFDAGELRHWMAEAGHRLMACEMSAVEVLQGLADDLEAELIHPIEAA